MSFGLVNRRQRSAFTMLEVLLAVAILGLVVTAIYSTWTTALAAWKRASDITDTFQRQRIVLDTLAELTQSLVFFNVDNDLYEVIGLQSSTEGDSISFVTGSDELLPPTESFVAGMRRVTISMQRDQWGRPFLGIINQPAGDDPDPSPDARVHVLSADVVGFAVRYRDAEFGKWGDKWEDNRVPASIEYTVAFRGGKGSTQPVIVTRAVDLPAAEFALHTIGQRLNEASTTNEVTRRDIDFGGPDISGWRGKNR